MSCLCLGPSGSGKSLLLKQLQNKQVTNTTVPIETIGTNIVTISMNQNKYCKSKDATLEKREVSIREVGGSMAPLWPSYYGPQIKAIIFVMDSSNLFQVSISTVLLLEILSHAKLSQSKVLLAFSKIDLSTRKKINSLKFMMKLEALIDESKGKLSIVEVSGLTGDGVEDVRQWIFTSCTNEKSKIVK